MSQYLSTKCRNNESSGMLVAVAVVVTDGCGGGGGGMYLAALSLIRVCLLPSGGCPEFVQKHSEICSVQMFFDELFNTACSEKLSQKVSVCVEQIERQKHQQASIKAASPCRNHAGLD